MDYLTKCVTVCEYLFNIFNCNHGSSVFCKRISGKMFSAHFEKALLKIVVKELDKLIMAEENDIGEAVKAEERDDLP